MLIELTYFAKMQQLCRCNLNGLAWYALGMDGIIEKSQGWSNDYKLDRKVVTRMPLFSAIKPRFEPVFVARFEFG